MELIDVGLQRKIEKILRKQIGSNFRVFELKKIEKREWWNEIETVELLKINDNRKEKSLEELCVRFIQKFIKTDNQRIQLDMVSYELGNDCLFTGFAYICDLIWIGVERRRIYDIINILESLDIVERVKKNEYNWNSINNIYKTIHGLEV